MLEVGNNLLILNGSRPQSHRIFLSLLQVPDLLIFRRKLELHYRYSALRI